MEEELEETTKHVMPLVYNLEKVSDTVPSGFNAVTISVDGQLTSSLDWREQEILANTWVSKGYNIFWEINLGLFDQLPHPLEERMQFEALSLSLVHFRDNLWEKFREKSLGLSIYRGGIDFSKSWNWTDSQESNLQEWLAENNLPASSSNQLAQTSFGESLLRRFCVYAALNYCDLLTSSISNVASLFACVDVSSIACPLEQAHLLLRSQSDKIRFFVKGQNSGVYEYSWGENVYFSGYFGKNLAQSNQITPKTALCVLDLENSRETILSIIDFLKQGSQPFKYIEETSFLTEWEELDYVIIVNRRISTQTKRQLQGFCAAGGTVVVIGPRIGLGNEINVDEFFSKGCA